MPRSDPDDEVLGTPRIDSSGLREFAVALKRQREIGGDLVLRAPTMQVRRVLDTVGLSEMLTTAEAAAPALAADGPGQSDTPSSWRR